MKIHELFESFSDKDLIALAKSIGEKMYGTSHTGLLFQPSIKREAFDEYASASDGYVDTYDFVFFPSTGKGLDAADTKLSKKHVDKDGKIYIGGANGVVVLSNPFKKVKHEFPTAEFEKFKSETLKYYPKATFKKPDKWDRVFAYVGDKMCAQFTARNDRTNNKPGWLVHDHTDHNW